MERVETRQQKCEKCGITTMWYKDGLGEWRCTRCGKSAAKQLSLFPELEKEVIQSCGALRFDTGKAPIHYIPPSVLESLALVYGFGDTKYLPRNWEEGMNYSRMYSSAMRHLLSWFEGHDLDAESGLPTLSHALWNIAGLIFYTQKGLGVDDRSKAFKMPNIEPVVAAKPMPMPTPTPTPAAEPKQDPIQRCQQEQQQQESEQEQEQRRPVLDEVFEKLIKAGYPENFIRSMQQLDYTPVLINGSAMYWVRTDDD